MNNYQEACQAIKQSHKAGRYKELIEKLKRNNPGKQVIDILADSPSRITKTWALMRIEKPLALIKGAPDFRPRQHICSNCKKPTPLIGITGCCPACSPGGFAAGRLNMEVG